ncbi:hypothetical protein GCM10027402_15460 [Arthrobacter monumenti]
MSAADFTEIADLLMCCSLFAVVRFRAVVIQQWPLSPVVFCLLASPLACARRSRVSPQGKRPGRMWEEISDAGAPDTFGAGALQRQLLTRWSGHA